MQFKLDEISTLSEKVYKVSKTCSHKMTSREILCETNFMEASSILYFKPAILQMFHVQMHSEISSINAI